MPTLTVGGINISVEWYDMNQGMVGVHWYFDFMLKSVTISLGFGLIKIWVGKGMSGWKPIKI